MSVKYDLIVIGAGPAGEKGAAQAAYFGKRVALVERSSVFGGAVASTSIAFKALRETALYLAGFRTRKLYGLDFQMEPRRGCGISSRRSRRSFAITGSRSRPTSTTTMLTSSPAGLRSSIRTPSRSCT